MLLLVRLTFFFSFLLFLHDFLPAFLVALHQTFHSSAALEKSMMVMKSE